MKQTENYGLNQWELTDRIQMEDFNGDNEKIDAALKTLANQVAGKADSATVSSLATKVNAKAEQSALNATNTNLNTLTAQVAKCGNCQIDFEAYTGDGTGSRTFTFSHKPLMLIAMGNNLILRAVRGAPYAMCRSNGDGGALCSISWTDNSVTWQDGFSVTNNAYIGCNTKDESYSLVAFLDAAE